MANNAASSGREHLVFHDNNLEGVWKLTPALDALTGIRSDDGLCLAAAAAPVTDRELRALQMHQTILHFIYFWGDAGLPEWGGQLNLPCITTPERGGWA